MVATKGPLLGLLLVLDACSFRVARRMAGGPVPSITRLLALATGETGVGHAIFLATASLVSQPRALGTCRSRSSRYRRDSRRWVSETGAFRVALSMPSDPPPLHRARTPARSTSRPR